MEKINFLDRRNFIAKTALGTLGAAGILTACSGPSAKKEEIQLPKLLEQARVRQSKNKLKRQETLINY